MNKNVCIILLIFLIVYLIYKISSNSCDCFSVGFSVGDGDETKCNLNNGNCNLECIDEDNKICGVNMNTSNTKNMHSCNDIEESDLVNFAECNDGYSLDVDWNSRGDGDYCIFSCAPSPPPPPPPPPIPCPNCSRLVPEGSVDDFFKRIVSTYNNPTSNGVFLSMIYNISTMEKNTLNKIPVKTQVFLDGSGSIVRKNNYPYLYPTICNFGFIWDVNWLDDPNLVSLVSCLFPRDADTTPFGNCSMSSQYNNLDTCELAATSTDGKTPDRCSKGIQIYFKNFYNKVYLYPTNCNENIKYIIGENPRRQKIENDKNCFTYITDEIKSEQNWNYYNEAVFLKDIDGNGIEINEGIKKLTELNKPTPVALIYVYNDNSDCSTDDTYKNYLRAIKLNFTPDTVVIKIYYESSMFTPGKLEFKEHKTLDQMPGYNNV